MASKAYFKLLHLDTIESDIMSMNINLQFLVPYIGPRTFAYCRVDTAWATQLILQHKQEEEALIRQYLKTLSIIDPNWFSSLLTMLIEDIVYTDTE